MQIHTGPHNISSFKQGLWWRILISCLLLLCIGGINSLWSNLDYKQWYDALQKPILYPHPRWIVGTIWSAMYILMGGAIGIIWQIIAKNRYAIVLKYAKRGVWIFILHILVNMSIPAFFFGLNSLSLVLIGVIVNLVFVLILIRHFFRLDRVSAFLLVPYAIWLLYATILDISFVLIN